MTLPNSSTTVVSGGAGKLGFLEKIGFGAGYLASNLLFQTYNMFLLFFAPKWWGWVRQRSLMDSSPQNDGTRSTTL